MYVIPTHPKVRDPDLRDYLPKEGREVPDTLFWQRRVQHHDVRKGEPPVAATPVVAALADE